MRPSPRQSTNAPLASRLVAETPPAAMPLPPEAKCRPQQHNRSLSLTPTKGLSTSTPAGAGGKAPRDPSPVMDLKPVTNRPLPGDIIRGRSLTNAKPIDVAEARVRCQMQQQQQQQPGTSKAGARPPPPIPGLKPVPPPRVYGLSTMGGESCGGGACRKIPQQQHHHQQLYVNRQQIQQQQLQLQQYQQQQLQQPPPQQVLCVMFTLIRRFSTHQLTIINPCLIFSFSPHLRTFFF